MSSNSWVQHTKKFAESKGIKFNEALKDPENKASYRMMKDGGSIKERLLATTQNQKELGANAGKKFISL
jgi:hypothetical protein